MGKFLNEVFGEEARAVAQELQECRRGDTFKIAQVEGKVEFSETGAVFELFVGILLFGSHLVEVTKDVEQEHVLKELSGA